MKKQQINSKRNILIVGICLAVIIIVAVLIAVASQSSEPYVSTGVLLGAGLFFTILGMFVLNFFMNYDPGKKSKKSKKSKVH
ncbi:hypothetical protein ACFL35_03080 [Candidatus Riflebacteria bacterium]